MFHYRTPKSIRAYNWFKLAGTLILICIFAMLLLREQRAAATAPVATPAVTATAPVAVPTATAQPLPTPQPPTPTVAAPIPSAPETEAGAPLVLAEAPSTSASSPTVSSTTVSATSAPQQPPTLTAPQSGALIAGNTVTLEGTGTPGVEIEILDQGEVVSTTVVQPDGTWTLDCLCDSGTRLLSVQNAGEPESVSEAVPIQVAVAPIPMPDDIVCGEEEDIPMGIDHGTVYVVAPCEYIGLIAARVGVKLADLLAANPQLTDPDRIDPGQILNLPPR